MNEDERRAAKRARRAEKRRRFPGLIQLALLLSLLPSILDYSLYSLAPDSLATVTVEEEASRYDVEMPCPPRSNVISLEGIFDDVFKGVDFIVTASVSAFVLFLPALLVGLWRRRWGWLAFGLAVPNLLALSLLLEMGRATLLIYMVASKIAFLWFLIRGRLWSKSYFVVVAAYVVYSGGTFLSEGFVAGLGAMKFLGAVILFALATHGLRILFLAVIQNLKLIPELGLLNTPLCLLKTLFFWSPLLALTLPGYLVNKHVSEHFETYVYSLGFVEKSGSEPNLEHDLRLAIRKRFQDQALAWCAGAQAFYDKIDRALTTLQTDTPGDLAQTVREAYRDIVPGVDELGLDDWEAEGSWNPFTEWGAEPGVNFVIRSVRGAYSTTVAHVERGLVAKARQMQAQYSRLRDASAEGGAEAQELIRQYKHLIPEAYQAANRQTQQAVVAAFGYTRGSQGFLQFVFLFIAIRSFLYVFGRIAFAHNTRALIGFGGVRLPDGETEPSIRIEPLEARITLSPEDGTDFYFARTFEAHGQPPRFIVPFGSVAPLARMRYGAYSMNHILFKGGEDPVCFTLSGGERFYAVHLRENAEVFFDYRYFAGMSRDVTLGSEVSARISTLLLNKIVFPIARGPGILYLRTDGDGIHGPGPETSRSIPPTRLVAWSRNTQFKTDSTLGFTDIYLSGIYVKRFGEGCLLIDADKRGKAKSGVVRFLRAFLSPF